MLKVTECFLNALACPDCLGNISEGNNSQIVCDLCQREFEVIGNSIISMLPSQKTALPEIYNDPEYLQAKKQISEIFQYSYQENSLIAYIHNSYHRWHQRLLCKQWAENKWIVDLGCGPGTHFSFLSKAMSSFFIGMDGNIDLLLKCSKNFPHIQLVLGDLCRLPFKTNHFHYSLSFSVLEHIYFLEKALDEVFRVLQSDGFFHVSLPTEGGFLWGAGRFWTTQRTFEKKKINYKKLIQIEHCNTAKNVLKKLDHRWTSINSSYYPFGLPSIHLNLFLNSIYKKYDC